MTPVAWIRLVLDTPVADVDDAVAFWSAITGWRPSERRGEDGRFRTLLPPTGSAYVTMQAVDQPAGIHLDLDSTDRSASIDLARSLGASTAWTDHDVEVMRSPGGFTFCQTLLDEAAGSVRAHPDLATADRAADVRRHVALGASSGAVHERWTVLTAPGGQVYCLTDRDPTTGRVQ